MVMRLADADLPVQRYADFADTVAGYLDEVKRLADTKRDEAAGPHPPAGPPAPTSWPTTRPSRARPAGAGGLAAAGLRAPWTRRSPS
jgi:hypothetical protein